MRLGILNSITSSAFGFYLAITHVNTGELIMSTLMTSLDEIRSFNPCASGWKAILAGRNKTEADSELFPLVECVESNSVSDVCWLLGKRKAEIQICVRFARMCADSVAHLNNVNSRRADAYAYAAADAAADAAAYADAYAHAYAADAYAYAYAAAAAHAYAAADAHAHAYAYADAAYADAYAAQRKLSRQFLIQCINEYGQQPQE
jgi:hypothetical protein